jgi:hypothetical protein
MNPLATEDLAGESAAERDRGQMVCFVRANTEQHRPD